MTAADLPPPTTTQRPWVGWGGRWRASILYGLAAAMAVSNSVRKAARADVSFQGESWGIDDFLSLSSLDSMAKLGATRHLSRRRKRRHPCPHLNSTRRPGRS